MFGQKARSNLGDPNEPPTSHRWSANLFSTNEDRQTVVLLPLQRCYFMALTLRQLSKELRLSGEHVGRHLVTACIGY